MIEAAGGLVLRTNAKAVVQVLVVHRPRYDDWSWPKGKLEIGETHLDAALREVAEETGLRCKAVQRLPDTTYRDHKGRRKRVCYWAMEVLGGSFSPSEEVDRVRWLTLPEALDLLSYPHDSRLLRLVSEGSEFASI